MKKLLILVTLFTSLHCFCQEIPFKNQYPSFPYQLSTTKGYDNLWDYLIHLFNEKGFGIHISDKSTGTIISNRFNINWTYEKSGKIKNDSAIMIVPMFHNKSNNTIYPIPRFNGILRGEFAATLKQNGNNVDVIIELKNVEQAVYDMKDGNTKYVPYTEFKSTGIIEREIKNKFSD